MKCHKCQKTMTPARGIPFNDYKIDGHRCSCGEIYFDSDQAQRILLLNKAQKESKTAKLGRIKSNLILRIPKELEEALDLAEGQEVSLKAEGKKMVMMSK